jgi:hypothetical protein
VGNQTSWAGPRLPASFSDGTSNTVSFAEGFGRPGAGTATSPSVEVKWFATMDVPGYAPNGSRANGPVFWVDGPPGYSNPPLFAGAPEQTVAVGDYFKPQVLSGNVVQVGLVDGSVRRIATSVSPLTWYLANHPADRQVLGSDW